MDYHIVAYDISDPKRLQKVHKKMKDYGNPLQLSLFECHLTPRSVVLMRDELQQVIEPQEDRILIARLCPSCKENIETIGRQKTGREPGGGLVV